MGSLTDYSENRLLDHMTLTAYTPVATVYLGLATADPTDAATGASANEVANSGAYARTAITFGASSSRRVTQSAQIDFPEATGSWGTVTHWFVTDNATYGSGNVLAAGAFATSRSIVSGNTPRINTSEVYVEITASNGISNYFANGFLDRMFRNQAFTISANYVLLATAAITDSTTGSTVTEPSGNNYSRVQVNAAGGGSPAWNAVSSSSVDNANQVNFPNPSGAWGTVTFWGLVDAGTVGNMLSYYNITDQAPVSGDTVFISAGNLVMTMS